MAVPSNFLEPNRDSIPNCFNTAEQLLSYDCANQIARLGVCNGSLNRISKLLNQDSNCYLWKYAVENAYDNDPDKYVEIAEKLDEVIVSYCNGAGINSIECRCLNMPIKSKTQCNEQSATYGCTNFDESECLGKIFINSNDDRGGLYTVIQFEKCISHVCWNDYCSGLNVLLKSHLRDLKKNCDANLCVSVNSQDNVLDVNTLSPENTSIFKLSALVQKCGDSKLDLTPSYISTTIVVPVDNISFIPIAISNFGSFGQLTFEKMILYNGNDIGIIPPESIFLSGTSVTNIAIQINPVLLQNVYNNVVKEQDPPPLVLIEDQSVLQARCNTTNQDNYICSFVGENSVISPTLVYTYIANGIQKTFELSFSIHLKPNIGRASINPKINPSLQIRTIPTTLFYALGIVFFLFLLSFFYFYTLERKALEISKELF